MMASGLSELYQELILDHAKQPRNERAMGDESGCRRAEGYNPLCGDRVTVFVQLADDDTSISDISFTGKACAICTASASMMTEALRGEMIDKANADFQAFRELLTLDTAADPDLEQFGVLAALAGVRRFPMRVKCATLPWHTMKAALNQPPDNGSSDGHSAAVTTE